MTDAAGGAVLVDDGVDDGVEDRGPAGVSDTSAARTATATPTTTKASTTTSAAAGTSHRLIGALRPSA